MVRAVGREGGATGESEDAETEDEGEEESSEVERKTVATVGRFDV